MTSCIGPHFDMLYKNESYKFFEALLIYGENSITIYQIHKGKFFGAG